MTMEISSQRLRQADAGGHVEKDEPRRTPDAATQDSF